MKKFLVLICAFVLASCGGGTSSTQPESSSQPASKAKAGGGGPCSVPRQLRSALGGASQSDVVSLYGVNPLDCPEVGMSQTWSGGKLVFSDSPEHPSAHGKVYEDSGLPATSGSDYNRVFLYHTNGLPSGRMKWTVLVKNNGTSAATLTVQKSGTAGPTTSYLYAGKMAFLRWLNSSAGSGDLVAPGATVRLDTTFDSVTTAASYLMTGIWDYSMDQPHTVTVCALLEGDDPLSVCPGLPVLPRDTHQRGTCPNADKVYDMASAVDTADDIQQFPLAGNTANDSNAQCTDATDGSQQELKGNFGVLYRMHLSITSTNGKRFGFLMNPRGGAWGGAAFAAPGDTPGGKFLIPAGTASLGDNTKGAVEGKYNPGSVSAPWLQWMPTGGSSLPLRFVAVPY